MKKIMLATLLLITSHIAFSQNDVKIEDKKAAMKYADTTEACNKDEIFMATEVAASYQGGVEKLIEDVNKNLHLIKVSMELFICNLQLAVRERRIIFVF
jgi:hypothetical protein